MPASRGVVAPALGLVVALAVLTTGCGHRPATRRPGGATRQAAPAGFHAVAGLASWYGPGFHGRLTASGEVYDARDLTCAHRTLPFGTRLLVRNLDNGRTCWVRVNDRGPFIAGRIIDLSYSAAHALAVVGPGTARVQLELGGERSDDDRATTIASMAIPPAVSEAPTPAPGPLLGGSDDPPSWSIQVGAFSVAENAARLAQDLVRRGIDARVVEDGSLARVWVGSFTAEERANIEADTLRHDGFDAVVVVKPMPARSPMAGLPPGGPTLGGLPREGSP